eukprot:scaffold111334_cov34-Tisochrysis_lutea.AAC.5
MVVEKSPAMAYPLAMLALSVGTRFEAVWHHLRHHFIHACSYVVPHYIRRPQGATDEQWKKVMGYAERGRGFEPKEQYYNRMAGYVTLWAAILQARDVLAVPTIVLSLQIVMRSPDQAVASNIFSSPLTLGSSSPISSRMDHAHRRQNTFPCMITAQRV